MGAEGRAASAEQARWRQLGYMALLISLWYLFSYLFNASLKAWFRTARQPEDNTMFPVLLTVFFSNTVAASLWVLQLTGCLSRPWRALHGMGWFSQVVASGGLRLDLGLMCSAGAVGIAAACIVLQHGSIQLVQVLRSMGPMFTAFWAWLILDQATWGHALLCLAIALAGTALASWREPTFSALTLCLMLTVNTALTFRNAVTKRVLRLALPTGGLLSPHSPNVPQALAPSSTAAAAAAAAAGEPAALSAAVAAACRSAFQAPEVISCVLLALTNAVGLAGVLLLWGTWAAWDAGGPDADSLPMQLGAAMGLPSGAWPLLAWMGVCNFMYNMASQIVLAHVQVVSHGMLELFKRVFVLITASLMLGDVQWAWHNALGAALATLGTVLYFTSHASHGAGRTAGLPPLHPGHGLGKPALAHAGGNGNGLAGASESQPLLPARLAHGHGGPSHSVSDTSHRAVGYALPGCGDGQCLVVKAPAAVPAPEGARRRLLWLSGGGSGGGAASRKLRLAYAAMLLVLLASPTQFLESTGVSSLTPSWLREFGPGAFAASGSWPRSDMDAAAGAATGAGSTPGLGNAHAGQVGGNGAAAGNSGEHLHPSHAGDPNSTLAELFRQGAASDAADGGGGGSGRSLISPGNFLLSGGTAMALRDLSLPPPDARLYAPRTIGSRELLVGGPAHRGLLPFHRTLPRAAPDGGDGTVCAGVGAAGAGAAAAARLSSSRRLAALASASASASATELDDMPSMQGGSVLALPRSLQQLLPSTGSASSSSGAASRSTSAASEATAAPTAGAAGTDNPPQQDGLVGVYTGWIGQDNLGDEIVADLFMDLLAAAVIQSTPPSTCVSVDRASPELLTSGWRGCQIKDTGACDFAVMGGGSTVYVDYVKRITGAINASRPTMLFGSGIQTGLLPKRSNPKYLRLLCQAKLLGGVRGSFTQGHLAKLGCSGATATRILRDSALLSDMLYGTGVTSLRPQLRRWSDAKLHVVVVTVKDSAFTSRSFASAVRTLLATGRFAIVLQGVDPESTAFNQAYAQALNSNLPPGAPPVVAHDEYQDWAAVLDLYRHASASLNSRLHSGVLSVSALRPTLYVASNVKYKDFMSSLGLRAQLVDEGRKRHVEAGPQYFGEYLAALVVDAVRQAQSIQSTIEQQQRESYQLYQSAMADLLGELERQDPSRFHATVRCCRHISVTRSTPQDKRVLIRLSCLQPGTGGSDASECVH